MKDLFIKDSDTVRNALNKLNKTAEKILFVVNKNDYLDFGQWEEYKKVKDKMGGL